MPDQTPEPPLQSDAALAELRARLAADGTLAPVPEDPAPLCPVCLCGVVDDWTDLDDGSAIHGECMPVDVMIGQINTERDESARLRARIAELEAELANARSWAGQENARLRARVAELEAAQSEPHAYIAVKRLHSPNATEPEWDAPARVIPAGDPHGVQGWYEREGYELLPIVGTETGTRFAAPQSDPDGYMVVGRTRSGGPAEVSSAIWDSTDKAALHLGEVAEVSGFGREDLFIAELREVQQ